MIAITSSRQDNQHRMVRSSLEQHETNSRVVQELDDGKADIWMLGDA